jgi:hypothetical protein
MLDDKPRNMSLKSYKKMKLTVLKDFYIELTPEQLARFNSLQTEIAIDQFVISAIQRK